ncbi:MAG: Large-conductance mechanosensitive channel, large conductance mechanosensitive channel [Candidatus Parcubacteria bacterium]|jgi:large conductance mechanosensitive channel
MKIIDEFKTFAIKGNAVDLAVGVVIGAAFGNIVTSFVEDIITPLLGLITGGIDFSDKALILKRALDGTAAVTLNYGAFITVVINFLIVAWAIFLVVKAINKLKEQGEKPCEPCEPEKPTVPSPEVVLLQEIRDSLRSR